MTKKRKEFLKTKAKEIADLERNYAHTAEIAGKMSNIIKGLTLDEILYLDMLILNNNFFEN